MKYRFHPEAGEELKQAAAYYKNIRQTLGRHFLAEIREAIGRVVENPLAWTSYINETRRCLVRRFPYGLVYAIEEDHILFLAVMHLRRKPGYWVYRK